ncbi:MAG: hypothetical protein IJ370_08390 [Oscillospiraceae bacterium]|nr:hypothetical protein [Oscillospiraceae bacterium]
MQYVAIALVWAAFVLFLLAARAKKKRRVFALLFVITAVLAAVALAAWGVLRNF